MSPCVRETARWVTDEMAGWEEPLEQVYGAYLRGDMQRKKGVNQRYRQISILFQLCLNG